MGFTPSRSGSRLRLSECFVRRITPRGRPAGYMVDGSFHGKLLSVCKTTLVSLTHQISRIALIRQGNYPRNPWLKNFPEKRNCTIAIRRRRGTKAGMVRGAGWAAGAGEPHFGAWRRNKDAAAPAALLRPGRHAPHFCFASLLPMRGNLGSLGLGLLRTVFPYASCHPIRTACPRRCIPCPMWAGPYAPWRV